MFNRKTASFRALTSTLAVLTTLFLSGQPLSQALAAERAQRQSLAEAAQQLGLSPAQLADPEAYFAQQRSEATARRKAALDEARTYAQAQVQQQRLARAKAEAQRVGAADPDAPVLRALAEARAQRLSDAQTQAKLAALNAPGLGEALRRGAPRPPERSFAPSRAQQLKVQQRTPRLAPRHGALTPQLRELYAEAQGGQTWVEQWNGALVPVQDVLQGHGAPRVQVASYGAGALAGVMAALPTPADEDLAQTPETLQTEEVKALAAKLGGTPLALYNWVHTRVEPELYYGSKKGAAATLAEARGNDFDQASLLIALLRASGVPARYEYGAVRLSAAQAQSLTGLEAPALAASLMSRAGIPAQVTEDGKGVLAERAWVRAFVSYGQYRGGGTGGGSGAERLWVRLDPGLKRMAYTQRVNLRGLVTFDFDAYLSGTKAETPLDVFEAQLLAAAQAKNLCNTLDDALLHAQMVQEPLRLLPAEHPAKVEQSLLLFSRPPENMRHFVDLTLDGQAQRFEMAELEGRSLSLRYPGATPADEARISQAGGLENVAPYQVKVAPSLRVDGVEVRRFAPVMPGITQSLTVRTTLPGTSPALSAHQPIAGSVYALGSVGGTPTAERITQLRQQATDAKGEEREDAQAQLALARYAQSLNTASRRITGMQGHVVVPLAVEGMAGRDLKVATGGSSNGTPVALARGLYVLDVNFYQALLSRDADSSGIPALLRLIGHQGSALEHKTWEETLSTPSVSAVRTLQAAASQGVKVYHLSGAHPAGRDALTGYPQDTLSHVDEALAAGWRVTIPERPVNYLQYTQQIGYILENPVTGEGGYRIGQLLNGGASTGPSPTPESGCNACGSSEEVDNSRVDMASGNWREYFVDLKLPNLRLPLLLQRTYASRARGLTDLGYGWISTYGVFLRPEADGDVTYVQDDWREIRFDRQANGTFVTPAGQFFALAAVAGGGWNLRSTDGVQFDFDAAGRLTRMQNASGHKATLVYAGGLLAQVLDTHGQPALTFTHVGSKLTEVKDRAGRSVRYAYEGDALVAATDATGETERYEYDGDLNLTARVDKRGKRYQNFYDFQDRWIGSRNPLGEQTSATYDAVKRASVYTDRNGGQWVRYHNADGNPVAVVDPLGNRTENTWQGGLLRTQKDARGGLTQTTYDARGNVLSIKDPTGALSTWSYDSTFSVVRTQTLAGQSAVFLTYDSAGRLKTRAEAGQTTSYTYDARGMLETVTAPGNAVERFTYTPEGRVETYTSPDSKVTRMAYDPAGFLTSRTDPLQGVERFEPDALGRIKAHVDPAGVRTEYEYDAAGHRTAMVQGTARTTFEFDAGGRMVKRTEPTGAVTRYEYDGEGRMRAQVDPRGGRTVWTRDPLGRVVETVEPDGARNTQLYCANASVGAQPCASVDALGNVTQAELDAAGRITRVVDPLGRLTARTFDAGGRLTSESGPGMAQVTYGYDTWGRIESAASPLLSVSYGYDARGNRSDVRAGGQNTHRVYDLANRVVSDVNPLGRETRYGYDDAGRPQTRTDASGQVHTRVYDAAGRLKERRFDDGTVYTFDYDAHGNRTLERTPSHERHLKYDAVDRLTRVEDVTLGSVIEYAYDAAGNRTKMTVDGVATTYAYDADNRLVRMTDAAGRATTFGYDALGRRAWVSRPNGVRSVYTYDAAGQLLSLVHTRGDAALAGFAYTYNADGTLASKRSVDGSLETYGYDEALRLTSVSYGNGRKVSYTLTAQGTRQAMADMSGVLNGAPQTRTTTYTNNTFNQVTALTSSGAGGATSSTAFAYDPDGNLSTETTGTQVRRHVYDREDRLRELQLPDGTKYQYTYDANGQRVSQQSPQATQRYLTDGVSVLAELDGAGATRTRYLSHPQAIDELLSFEQAGSVYFPLADALGSIYAVTDASGRVVKSYGYDAFGERTSSTSGGPQLALGFMGREHDASGLRYHRDRYASPALGRWTQPDRRGMADGFNLYAFARGNPVSGRDPFGFDTEMIIWQPVYAIEHYKSAGGHVSMRINDMSYSWETGGMKKPIPFSEYLEAQKYREGNGYILDFTPLQESQLEYTLLESTDFNEPDAIFGVYNLITRNCGQIASRSLYRAGLSEKLPWYDVHPNDVESWIQGQPFVIGSTYYPQREFEIGLVQSVQMYLTDVISGGYFWSAGDPYLLF
ncbi:hypothetical protein FGE12_07500 [Aggregicoccus sp. 17bor-14]|uniref:RHS repeat-associated core domain-containing protein n=1 Tax=Myxococcaceae TaxID=31 RepID=UPI00129C759A|nr:MULTISPECIES: RHS repeat-associated core domain-containing protein [Myxococcaceae]MBF5042238.1 hypothetical protein [Simulacricoccus sp. 17bor-14]MRI88013.1 hypothetical protein [Aggregicoccus sp. 17bor-14]